MKVKRISVVFLLLVASIGMSTSAEETAVANISVPAPVDLPFECGIFDVDYGPFDYTNYDHYTTKLALVESAHFTYEVEALIRGKSSYLYGDLDYTLRHFPNHHRALNSISRFEFVVENPQVQIDYYVPVDCYFQNAMKFKPNDGVVRLIYGTYLHKKGMAENEQKLLKKARMQYGYALQLMPQSAEVHYNMSLYYLDMNNLSLAAEHGHKAYELGFPLPGLKDKLKRKGVWDHTVSLN